MTRFLHCGKIAGRRLYLFENTGQTTGFGSKRSQVRILSPRPTYLTIMTDVSLAKGTSFVSHSTPVFHGYLGSFWPSSAGKLRETRNPISSHSPQSDRSIRAIAAQDTCVHIGILPHFLKKKTPRNRQLPGGQHGENQNNQTAARSTSRPVRSRDRNRSSHSFRLGFIPNGL